MASESLEDEDQIRMAIWFDNEEVGSESAHGAMSTLVSASVDRIANALNCPSTTVTCFLSTNIPLTWYVDAPDDF